MELGWLNSNTNYVVERVCGLDYISINHGVQGITADERLKSLTYPVTSLCVSYVIAGCDYVSSFYNVTHNSILLAFLENAAFVKDLVSVSSSGASRGQVIKEMRADACMRLICTAYFRRRSVRGTFPEAYRDLPLFLSAASTAPPRTGNTELHCFIWARR